MALSDAFESATPICEATHGDRAACRIVEARFLVGRSRWHVALGPSQWRAQLVRCPDRCEPRVRQLCASKTRLRAVLSGSQRQ